MTPTPPSPKLPTSFLADIESVVGEPVRLVCTIDAGTDEQCTSIVVVERGGPPSARMLREAFGLTRREADVAVLLVDRLSNREIAARLVISTHTVRRHVEKVLAKLDIHSRTEVREIAKRLRPTRRGALR